jgi:hypothetical protein
MTFRRMHRPTRMRLINLVVVIFASVAPLWSQTGQLKTSDAVLDQYKHALGGVEAIKKVQSETRRGEIEDPGMTGKATFVYYAKPFKTLLKVRRANGTEVILGFDGSVSWSITPQGASIDKDTALEAVRRDADLQYALPPARLFPKSSTSLVLPISKAAPAIGFTASRTGARIIISSMMPKPDCSLATVFRRTTRLRRSRPPCFKITKASAGRWLRRK